MRKIISLFQRNYDGDRLVRDEVVPGAEWVLAGQGTATRKWDGTCVLIEAGQMWKRYEVKKGKNPPAGFRAANDVDENTGKQQGWLPVSGGPDDRWHREALASNDAEASDYPDGTYELVGPKIQGNPDGFKDHTLLRHGLATPQPHPARSGSCGSTWPPTTLRASSGITRTAAWSRSRPRTTGFAEAVLSDSRRLRPGDLAAGRGRHGRTRRHRAHYLRFCRAAVEGRPMATHPQLQKLAIIRNKSGKTRQEWFNWVNFEVGRRVQSNRELTNAEASHLIDITEAGVA